MRASIGKACGLAHCGALACRWPGMAWPVLGGVLLASVAIYWPGIGQGLAGHLSRAKKSPAYSRAFNRVRVKG